MDVREEMEAVLSIKVATDDITSFQRRVAEPFVSDLESNISSRFTSQDVVSSFGIFDPQKMPSSDSADFSCHGEDSIDALIQHYGKDLPAESMLSEEFVMPALVSSDLKTEWKTYRRYITNQPKENMKEQLKELSTNSMLETMFPNLSVLAKVCLSIPVGTASVERSFSHMKMIKSRLRSRLGECNLSHLMKISIESPQKLSNDDLEQIVDIWNRKPRRLPV